METRLGKINKRNRVVSNDCDEPGELEDLVKRDGVAESAVH